MVTYDLVAPVWTQLILSLLYLTLVRYVEIVLKRNDLRHFYIIAALFLIQDLVSPFLSQSLADRALIEQVVVVLALLVLIHWSGSYRRSNRSFFVATAVVTASILTGILAPPTVMTVRFFVPMVITGILFVAFARIDHYALTAAAEVEGMRTAVEISLVITFLAFLLLPLARGATHLLTVIAVRLPFWVVIGALQARSVENLRLEITYQRDGLNHIFAFMTEVGNSARQDSSPREIIDAALESIIASVDADGGVGILREDGVFRVCSARGICPPPAAVPPITMTRPTGLRDFLLAFPVSTETPLWGRALRTGTAVLVSDARSDESLRMHAEDRVILLRSMVAVPLTVRGDVFGMVVISRRGDSRPFRESSRQRAESMASFVALTLDNYYGYRKLLRAQQLQRDLDLATEIQKALLPQVNTRVGQFEMAAFSEPVRGVGGDYHDVIPLENGRFAVIICDVTGKGMPAALVMMMIRTATHLAFRQGSHVGTILSMINTAIVGAVADDRFATASVVLVDDNSYQVHFANAGHHPMLMYDGETRSVVEFDADGLPLGIEESAEYPVEHCSFSRSSWALLYTDGILESTDSDGVEFGETRLKTLFAESAATGRNATEILEAMMRRFRLFLGSTPAQDDLTLIVFGIPGPAPADGTRRVN